MLAGIDAAVVLTAVIVVLVVRPAPGIVALLGSAMTGSERATVAFFGIKGIGSVYYLAYALSAEDFAATATLWSTVAVTILLSPFLHGMLATTVLGWLDRHPR